jgi:hypothetical protein
MTETKESPMPSPLSRFLAADHVWLDGLLQRAVADAGAINLATYAAFRAGLLTHISLEEKILLPAAQRWHGGTPLPLAAKLRLDHGALAALLVPTPTPAIIAAIRTILAAHNSSAAAELISSMFPQEAARWQYLGEEAGLSRVYAGIHYPSDERTANQMGKRIAVLAIQRDQLNAP